MAAKQLSELRKGDKGRIVKIRGKGSLHRRLLDVGVI
ncbi:FeoA domain-containing protein, partial [Dehalococcoidia bacterium]|nr:FeoA domain-containing protein [Dehalococcoidia bacterium]